MTDTTLDERASRAANALRAALAARTDFGPATLRRRPLRPLAAVAALALVASVVVIIEANQPSPPPTATPAVLARVPAGSTKLAVGSWIWVAGAPQGGGQVAVEALAPATGAVVHTFSIRGSITGMFEHSGVLYAVTATAPTATLYALDPSAGTTHQWNVPINQPEALVVVDDTVWIAGRAQPPAVWAVDPVSGRAIRHLLPPPTPLGITPASPATEVPAAGSSFRITGLYTAGGSLLVLESGTVGGQPETSAVQVDNQGSYAHAWMTWESSFPVTAATEDDSFWALDEAGILLARQSSVRTQSADIPAQQWMPVYSQAYLLHGHGNRIGATATILVVGDGKAFWRIDRHTARLDHFATISTTASTWTVAPDGSLFLLDSGAGLVERVPDPGPTGHGQDVCGGRSPGPQPPNPVLIGCPPSADRP